MSIEPSANGSFNDHTGKNASGTASNPRARLLSIRPNRRLMKLAIRSPAIVSAPNNAPIRGSISKITAATKVKQTDEHKPLHVLVFPNKRFPSFNFRPPSIGQSNQLPKTLFTITGAPLDTMSKLIALMTHIKQKLISITNGIASISISKVNIRLLPLNIYIIFILTFVAACKLRKTCLLLFHDFKKYCI